MSSITRKQALDLIERAAATAVQAFLATWVVGDLGSLKAAGVAAAAAGQGSNQLSSFARTQSPERQRELPTASRYA